MRWLFLALSILLVACGDFTAGSTDLEGAREIPMRHTRIFKVYDRDGYRVVDIEASVVAWGGAAGGPPQRARLVLLPKEAEAPPLTGDLVDATIIRTPVMRIAVNDQPHEAMIRALGIADRIVAVGGHQSFVDDLRRKALSGEIRQVGYGWHMAPTLDALVGSKPDVFIARQADLTHTQHIERIAALGIPVVPTFLDTEPHYLGRTEWVRLIGMLTGREAEADAFVAEVEANIERLKTRAAMQPRRSLLWAWYRSAGDRWAVTQRNADAALIRDANAELVFGEADDPQRDSFSDLSTERLLESATDVDCWVIRDPLSALFADQTVLSRFKAYREGCVFHQSGLKHPAADSYEIYEMGVIRPDWVLEDLIKIVHPELRDGSYRYFRRETWEDKNAGASGH